MNLGSIFLWELVGKISVKNCVESDSKGVGKWRNISQDWRFCLNYAKISDPMFVNAGYVWCKLIYGRSEYLAGGNGALAFESLSTGLMAMCWSHDQMLVMHLYRLLAVLSLTLTSCMEHYLMIVLCSVYWIPCLKTLVFRLQLTSQIVPRC